MKINDEEPKLADQDILNSYLYYNPSEIVILHCRWNKRKAEWCLGPDNSEYYLNNTGMKISSIYIYIYIYIYI